MKAFSPILLACAFTVPSFAQEIKTNAAAAQTSVTNKTIKPVATFLVSAGEIKAPFVLANGIISQPEETEITEGGKAVYSFTITNAGEYIIKGIVNAPDDSANSFFVNVDAQPAEDMIWDIESTNGFEERTVGWRGNGDASSDEFASKHFKLSAGEHKLYIVGREPAELKSISICPAAN